MPGTGNVTIRQPKLLLVEGRDEEEFFRHLLKFETIDDIQIIGYGGKGNIGGFLKTLPALSNFEDVERLAVTRDADDNAASANESMATALRNALLPLPDQSGTKPQVLTVAIPPDKDTGCLESMIWEAIADENGLLADCIDEFVECAEIPRSGMRLEKARLHAFVATQKAPGLKLGEATRAGFWPVEHRAFDPMRALLRQLSE